MWQHQPKVLLYACILAITVTAVCEMPGKMHSWREELLVKAGVFYKELDRSSGQLCSVTDTPTELPSSGKCPELEREIIFHSVCVVSGKNL